MRDTRTKVKHVMWKTQNFYIVQDLSAKPVSVLQRLNIDSSGGYFIYYQLFIRSVKYYFNKVL